MRRNQIVNKNSSTPVNRNRKSNNNAEKKKQVLIQRKAAEPLSVVCMSCELHSVINMRKENGRTYERAVGQMRLHTRAARMSSYAVAVADDADVGALSQSK